MGIQQQIDAQLKDEKFPRASITVKNESGSFELKKGVRVTLIKCSATLDGAEEDCQVDFVDCDSVEVSDFKKGKLRITRCSSVKQLEAEDSVVNFGDTKVEELKLTRCQSTYLNSEIQTATLEQCDIQSTKNKYQDLTVTGGKLRSYEDECETGSLEEKANIKFSKLEGKELTIDKSTVTLIDCKSEKLEITDGHLTDLKGEHKEITVSGDKSSCSFNDSKASDEVSFSDATVFATKMDFESEVSVENCHFIGKKLSVMSEFSAKKKEIVIVDSEFQGETSFEDASIRLNKCSFQAEFSLETGSLDSNDCEYQGEFSLTEANINSRNDSFMGTVSMEDLVGPNSIANSDDMQELTITGGDSCGITLTKVTSQTADISEVAMLHAFKCEFQELKLESFTHAVLDDCKSSMAEIKDGSFLNTGLSQLEMLEISDVQCAITSDLSSMTAKDSGLIDKGSTIEADSCFIQSRGSNVIALSSLITNIGGNIEGTDTTVVITKGGEVMNLDGLTIGDGFEPDEQGGSVKFNGIDLTLQSTLGNVDIISRAGNITATADIGAILINAAMNVEIGAGLEIIELAGESVSITAGMDVTVEAGANAAILAAGEAELGAEGVAIVNSAGLVNIAAPLNNVLGITEFAPGE